MNRSTSRRTPILGSAAVIVALAAVLLVASGALGGSPTPTATPAPTPTASPAPTDAPAPSPSQPVDHPPIDGDVTIDLETATDHDVTATIRDESGAIVKVGSGDPGDGMSVGWGEVRVENAGRRTIRITWVGLAVDEVVHVAVSRDGGGFLVDIVQDGPVPNSDATGYDRVLELTFDTVVDAARIEAAVASRTPSS